MRILLITSLLSMTCFFCYSQYSNMEMAMGFESHDFSMSPVGNVKTKGKGKVKFMLVISSSGELERVELIKNDFDDHELFEVCKQEIDSLKFIPPKYILEGEKYWMTAEFKFNNRFKSFSLSQAKKYSQEGN